MKVSRKEGERAREKRGTHRPFFDPEQNVGLEDVQHEEVGAGGFRREMVFATVGGGALEGSQEGGVPATLA